MKGFVWLRVSLLGLLMFMSFGLFAQETADSIRLSGRVVDATGVPISAITLHLEGTPYVTYSRSDGSFTLEGVPAGVYSLRVGGGAYQVYRDTIRESREGMEIALEETVVNIDQVVVTGTGTHHRLKESPVPIDVFTQREFTRAGISDFNQFLSFANASLNVSSSSMGSSMTLNGLRGRHIVVMVDGQRLYGDVSGDLDLARIDMSTVKQIEVLKGASSALYGSDAMGGVINIITEQGKSPYWGKYYTQYGVHNQYTHRATVGITNLGPISAQTSFMHSESDGWQLNDKAYVKKKGGKVELEDTKKLASGKFKTQSFNQRLQYSTDFGLKVGATVNLYRKINPRPYDAYDYDFLYRGSTYGVDARYLIRRGIFLTLEANNDNYSYTRHYNKTVKDKKTKEETHQLGQDVLAKRQRLFTVRTRGSFDLGAYNKLSAIADWTLERLENPEALPGPRNVQAGSLSLQNETSLFDKDLQTVVGVRLVYHERFKFKALPRVSVMYQAFDCLNMRASYAAGYRAPDLMELFYEKETSRSISSGNPNLRPESNHYFSLNFEYVHPRATVAVTGFWNEINHLIERVEVPLTENDIAVGIPQRLQYQNTSRARTRGAEFTFTGYVGWGFAVGGSYAFTDARNLNTGDRLSKSYQHGVTTSVNWLKEWSFGKLNVNVSGMYQSERREYTEYGNAPAFQLWNASVRYAFFSRGKNIVIEPGIMLDNIFNYRDTRPWGSYYSTDNPGRSVVGSLLVRFK